MTDEKCKCTDVLQNLRFVLALVNCWFQFYSSDRPETWSLSNKMTQPSNFGEVRWPISGFIGCSVFYTLAFFGISQIALLAKLLTNEEDSNIFQMFMPRKVREQENEISAKLVSRNRWPKIEDAKMKTIAFCTEKTCTYLIDQNVSYDSYKWLLFKILS